MDLHALDYPLPMKGKAIDRPIGKRFRIKIAGIFSLLVILPSLVMAIFALLFLQRGLQSWFHDRVKTAIQESHYVAKGYLSEHQKVMQHVVNTMDKGLQQLFSVVMANSLFSDPESVLHFYRNDFNEFLSLHEALRSIHAIVLTVPPETLGSFQSPYVSFRTDAHSRFFFSLGGKIIKRTDLQQAQSKGMHIFLSPQGDQVFALKPLDSLSNSYLFVSRAIDKNILERMNHATESVDAYDHLLSQQKRLVFNFVLMFIGFTLILLCTAILGGLIFARRIIHPISALINSTQNIRQGHTEPINEKRIPATAELKSLMQTFNAMNKEMGEKKKDLENANQKLTERSFVIESVLEGISSGVMSLTREGQIVLCNHRAQELLHYRGVLEKSSIRDVADEFLPLFKEAIQEPDHLKHTEITFNRLGRPLILRLHIKFYRHTEMAILTFDDVSDLIAAQKKSAWADVARRIAHEIKNPLTPIALSAERLRRRYLPLIHDHPEIFQDCIETIIRQVHHIGKLISEFSSFARMPTPVMRQVNFDSLVTQIVTLHRQAYPQIVFDYTPHPLSLMCDPHQIEQVLTNILKNALEAIDDPHPSQGVIKLFIEEKEDTMTLHIVDNGAGVSCEKVLLLHEPYVTTKAEGMGLGLAIVQKILSDHGGKFLLQSDPLTGGAHAFVTLNLKHK